MELLLDRCHVGIDVSVVVFEIVEDERAWSVMNEFRTLVEEGRIVFIRFDNEAFAMSKGGQN